ncbi:MAG: 30S ribosomal protein S6 [Patescibacteria group bacterium]
MYTVKKDKVKRNYEFTYLLPGGYTQTEIDKTKSEIEALVKKFAGKLLDTQEWGKKALSFKIKKNKLIHNEALYHYLELEFEPKSILGFEKAVNLMPQVIRHLLVLAEVKK